MFDIRKVDESRPKKPIMQLKSKAIRVSEKMTFLFKKAMHISSQKAGTEYEENLSCTICSSSILSTYPLHPSFFSI